MRYVYSFHLFLFFACSGFLGKDKSRKICTVIRDNFMRLLVPYLIWSVITQVGAIVFHDIDLIQALKNVLFLNADVGWNAAFWFLVSLFWADTLCFLIVNCSKCIQYIFVGVLLLWFLITIYKTAFGLKESSAGTISRLIKEALEKKLIKPLDSNTAPRYMKYIPVWA